MATRTPRFFKSVQPYSCTIWIAIPGNCTAYGGIWYYEVKKVLADYCRTCTTNGPDDVGLCVTLQTNVDFLHKDGEEYGYKIGLVNYPRFPKTREQIRKHAFDIAFLLVEKLKQKSALVDFGDDTVWISPYPFLEKSDGQQGIEYDGLVK